MAAGLDSLLYPVDLYSLALESERLLARAKAEDPAELNVKYAEIVKIKLFTIRLRHWQKEISQLPSSFNWKSYQATQSKIEKYQECLGGLIYRVAKSDLPAYKTYEKAYDAVMDAIAIVKYNMAAHFGKRGWGDQFDFRWLESRRTHLAKQEKKPLT